MKSIVSLLADPVSYDVRHATLVPFLGRSVAWRDKTFALGTLAGLSLGAIAVATICLYNADLRTLFVTCYHLVLNLNCPILLCSYFVAIA